MKKKAIHHGKVGHIENGKVVWKPDRRDVEVMAISGKWAMVRRPACMPYTCLASELEMKPHPAPAEG